jgi:hypothetical protein
VVEGGRARRPQRDRLDQLADPEPEQRGPHLRRDGISDLLDPLHQAGAPRQRDPPLELRRKPTEEVRLEALEVALEPREILVALARRDRQRDQLAERIRVLLQPIRVDLIRADVVGRLADLAFEIGVARRGHLGLGLAEVAIDQLVEPAGRRRELADLRVLLEPLAELLPVRRALERVDQLREVLPDDLDASHLDLLVLDQVPDQLPRGNDAIHPADATAPGTGSEQRYQGRCWIRTRYSPLTGTAIAAIAAIGGSTGDRLGLITNAHARKVTVRSTYCMDGARSPADRASR